MGLSRSLVLLAVVGAATASYTRDEHGGQLLSRASEISDIHHQGASPFTLKAEFRVHDRDKDEVGTYTEIWLSNEKWRREAVAGHSRRLELGSGRKKWMLDEDLNPRYFNTLSSNFNLTTPPKEAKVKEVRNGVIGGLQVSCIRTESPFLKETYCVDPRDGTLLQRESVLKAADKSKTTVQFADYQPFGDRLFPRQIHQITERQGSIDITVSELSSEVSSDAALFAAPVGAVELGNCDPGKTLRPQVQSSPDPEFPANAPNSQGYVVLSLVVGTDGKTHLIHVVQSGGEAFDVSAVRAVQQWKFRPATCQGEPIATMINVDVEFRPHR